jgi:hypothetical protein
MASFRVYQVAGPGHQQGKQRGRLGLQAMDRPVPANLTCRGVELEIRSAKAHGFT